MLPSLFSDRMIHRRINSKTSEPSVCRGPAVKQSIVLEVATQPNAPELVDGDSAVEVGVDFVVETASASSGAKPVIIDITAVRKAEMSVAPPVPYGLG